MPLIHLPGLPPEPDRWINLSAIEWAAPLGEGTVIRLRTGDTLKTALGIMSFVELVGEVEAEIREGKR